MSLRTIITLVALAWTYAPCLGANRPMLIGSPGGLWLLSGTGERFDLAFRPVGGTWQWVAHNETGRPALAAATDRQVHVLFSQPPAYLVYGGGGEPRPLPLSDDLDWRKGTLIAACAAGPDAPSDVIVIISTLAGASSTQAGATSATAPATQPATTRATGPSSSVDLVPFRRTEGAWRRMDPLTNVRLGADARVLAAAGEGKLTILVSGGERSSPLRLWTYGGVWQSRELGGELAGMTPLAIRVGGTDIDMLLHRVAPDAPRTVHLAKVRAGEAQVSATPLTLDGEPFVGWNNPRAAFAGDRPALVWRDERGLKFAMADTAGRLNAPEFVRILETPPQASRVNEEIRNYINWAIILVVLIPLVLFRAKPASKPFSLPQQLRPGHLGKRLAAAMVDLMPFLIVGVLIAYPEALSNPDALRATPQPDEAFYGSLAGLAAYVVYCIIMEMRTGATLGKRLMHLRVVGDEGAPPGPREAAMRNLLKLLEFSSVLLLPLFLLPPLVTRYRQRLGDMIARTAVVDAPP